MEPESSNLERGENDSNNYVSTNDSNSSDTSNLETTNSESTNTDESNNSNSNVQELEKTMKTIQITEQPPPQPLPQPAVIETYEQPFNADQARALATDLIHKYFTTQDNALSKHQTESFDQFIQKDLPSIISAQNPLVVLKNEKEAQKSGVSGYKYKCEIYIGGIQGNEIFVGTPTLQLNQGREVRLLFPNEARLRNLTYSLQVQANILVRITVAMPVSEKYPEGKFEKEFIIEKHNLCNFPLMLHSAYCLLKGQPAAMLTEMGECPQDQGGYFIIDGSEKVLITRQEGAFNTLWITNQPSDNNVAYYASISCLNPETHDVKRISFYWTREQIRMPPGFGEKKSVYKPSVLEVGIPYVLKPIPVFVLFRALGIQTDKDILQLIFPDFNDPNAKLMADMLIPSINAANPFMDTFSAVQYIKTLTKGFSEFHVLDILHNYLFAHVDDLPGARVAFLADCVRKILRVVMNLDQPPSRDDTRNQRLLTSGFLCQMRFQYIYKEYVKLIKRSIAEKFVYNESIYKDENFEKIFSAANQRDILQYGFLTDMVMSGFKGKWETGPNQEQSGVLQEMSRLSYLDFMSHVRRVVLNFDTGMKLTGPRQLRASQYGYFCTSETPSGSHIGITKNMSIMTTVSTNCTKIKLLEWLYSRGRVVACKYMTPELASIFVPVYLNSGIIGYTSHPDTLVKILRYMKRSGYLPPLSSNGFSIPERKVFIYMDEGRPLRPLIICHERGHLPPIQLFDRKTWRDYVVGLLRPETSIDSREFVDPLADIPHAGQDILKKYIEFFEREENKKKLALIEYIDPFEQNEALIANYPEHVTKETTHMEVHPSTIMGLLGNMIPYPNHNQSPRNQLSSSQSKQGLSLYATNFQNRFDNTANVLVYGQAPLSRTIYQDYVGNGKMPYGQNIILAMGMYGGYNQEDGIIVNADALARGQFRSINYRSYEAFEEDDKLANTRVRIGNPKEIAGWTELKPNLDYSKLDDSGIVRVGEYVDQNTVIVARYLQGDFSGMRDASVTPQVWTRGRVEKVVVTVNNMGLRLVKIRVVQDRTPELGDKFCLSPDHDVMTENGWIPIYQITTKHKIAQYNRDTKRVEYVHPLEVISFDHSETMYEVVTSLGTQYVTAEHRLFLSSDTCVEPAFIQASLAYFLQTSGQYYMLDETMRHIPIDTIRHHGKNITGDKVYCLSVPSEVFLVKRARSKYGFWTGNSNRHGQKGTINIMYRGHDMPRTSDGIVPDMIMNPTAIPSRMTIGQLLEMILGNVAANIGAIGNCTAFMNDGSPHEMLGKILEEKFGLHKLCNQVLYNGMTGEQIEADIFMGPVYGMRLKHMTEDKWNARGQGRKEQRTRQPTGGRGNEGGLRIGEMDRDAICAHGIAGFIQESIMERSDKAEFIVCNGCGTIPIYNEKQGLYICPLCDGPIQYVGDTVNSIEPIPPQNRSATSFSKVQFPYASKLFYQEMETYLNIGCRMLTTRDTMRLKGLDSVQQITATNVSGISQPLPALVVPEQSVPELPPKPTNLPTQAQLSAQLAELDKEQDIAMETFKMSVPEVPVLPESQKIPVLVPKTTQVQQTAVLAPDSIAPRPIQVPQSRTSIAYTMVPSQPIEGAVVAETAEGQPIIQVSTDEESLRQAGLFQPTDAVKPIERPVEQKPKTATRKYIRRYEEPSAPSQIGGQFEQEIASEPEESPSQPSASSAPLKVIKLG
jgi:DNA-directed RNA polymerase II subunit RPB2